MPAHSVPADDVVDEIARLEKKGNRIVQVVPAGEGAFIVVTETRRPAPGGKETRA